MKIDIKCIEIIENGYLCTYIMNKKEEKYFFRSPNELGRMVIRTLEEK